MKHKKAVAFISAAMLAAGYIAYENNSIGITRYEIPVADPALVGMKICHLSDIHVKTNPKSYSSLIKKTTALEPDIIVISGDLIDSRVSDFDAAASLCETLCEIAPVYYVTGNHEERLPADLYFKVINSLSEAGVHVLDNRAEDFEYNGLAVNIMGIFDSEYPELSLISDLANNNKFNILISHRPQFAEEYAEAGADLTFCGHAHGGQVRIPFVGGLIAPDQMFFPKFTEGVHEFGGRSVVISRGIGPSIIPMRINNRPEIVLAVLTGAGK